MPQGLPQRYQSCKLLKGKLKAVIKNSFMYTRIYLNFQVICVEFLLNNAHYKTIFIHNGTQLTNLFVGCLEHLLVSDHTSSEKTILS